MSKISDKMDKFLLNYNNLFWGPFLSGQCREQIWLSGCNICATLYSVFNGRWSMRAIRTGIY